MRQVAEHTALGNLVWALRRKIRIPGSAKLPPVFARRFSIANRKRLQCRFIGFGGGLG